MIDVDLFEGAGGAASGLRSIGLPPVGFEWNADACATARAAGHHVVRADLSSYPFGHLRGRVRLMHGSPPCQPFSAAGDGVGKDDPRDGMPWMLRAVDEARPDLVTIENVPGLLHRKHRRYFGAFITALAVAGYSVEYRVLNAADYGVPQTRQRLIIVARADRQHVRWPRPTHAEHGARGLTPWRSMADALGWGLTMPYPTIAAGGSSAGGFDGQQVGGSHARAKLFTGTDWRPGGDSEDAQSRDLDRPAPTVSAKSGGQWQVRTTYNQGGVTGTRHHVPMDRPAPTVVTSADDWYFTRPATTVAGDTRVHPPGHKINADDIANGRTGHDRAGTNAIRVTLDELAALQGFPAGYPFHGNRTSIARQIGNALPPALIAAVLRENT